MALTAPDFGPGTTGTQCTVTVQCVDLPLNIQVPLTAQQVADWSDADLTNRIDALKAAVGDLMPTGMTVTGSAQWQIYGALPAAT
jgi:hypothetical protein